MPLSKTFSGLSLVLPAALALGIAAAMPAMAQAQETATAANSLIVVTGEGHEQAKPDMAIVSLGVTEEADTAAEALDAMSAATKAVMERLAAAGIPASDVQTGQLSLDPRYNYATDGGNGRIDGFTASTLLEVKVTDLDGLGDVLAAVVSEGANRLAGVRFDLADPAPVVEAARRAAVADARARAELYADAAGVQLGALRTITETGGGVPPMPLQDGRMMDMVASVPVAAGELTISASVTLAYDLAEPAAE